ncbi:MAG: CRISPR-associated helicase Cas3' [Burkholderiales bacterium]
MFRYWGKARPVTDHGPVFHALPYHSLDVAAVGVEYLRRASSVRHLLVQALRIKSDAALEGWVAFWLALHDLGKFSEAFQSQRADLFEDLRGRPPDTSKSYRVRHDTLGMLFWSAKLAELAADEAWFGPDTESHLYGLDYWMRAVTGHHGQPPKEAAEFWEQHFDSVQDRAAIFAFVARIRSLLVDETVAAVPSAMDAENFRLVSMELSWWIAGLAVLADWLGSNTDFFAYRTDSDHPSDLTEYWKYAKGQAVLALDAAGVIPLRNKSALGFAELFPGIIVPSPLQAWADTVELGQGPQIHLLEDVTGAGKTEAAVMLAHRLIAAGCADGFFIGLPTMATANAMYDRIAQVYGKLFLSSASLALAHSQRNLVEAFAESILPPGPRESDAQQADDTATARCTSWLADHNKRSLLAPAGVGTIDQALLAVLHSKHQSLRLLGLFRKVLLVDEVHACDVYMQGVLEALLEFHARVGGSAILLSATLPQRMKQALLNAFARGCRSSMPTPLLAEQYPLVTSWYSGEPDPVEHSLPTRDDVPRVIDVRYVRDEDTVVAAIEAALAEGKCVCWIRNTVADALTAFEMFRNKCPAARLTLFHARFALWDRLRIERKVLAWFGERSTPLRRRGRLVIATQVIEQSLDVDFDFVVTDLAPVDRLIQRAGRLQRHPRDERGRRLRDASARDRRGKPCVWVFGPPWSDDPPSDWYKKAFPKAAGVYPNHGQLWLTTKSLRDGHIAMPEDARRLIEGVFGEKAEFPAGLQSNADTAEGKGYADASLARQNTIKLAVGYERGGMDWWSEAKTPSRLGEATMKVLLARWDGERLRPWIDGHHGWAYSSVRIPERLIARRAEASIAARETAVLQLLQSFPGKGDWSVLLPLEEMPKGWIGAAWSAPTPYKPERLLKWVYDPLMGLRQCERDVSTDEGVE